MTESNTPSFIAYHVNDRNVEESYWTKFGAAWAHADGKGYTVQIDLLPPDGRITLRVPTEKKK